MDGNRIKKTSGGVTTRTFFPGVYEEEVSGSTTTAIKHYSFNGMRIAIRKGGVLSYVHTDHLGSSSLATDSAGAIIGGSTNGPVSYYAYGAVRSGTTANLQTDRTFTGQKQDGTGLLYYNARYYDSSLGTFLSPDTLVPDAGRVVDYNRFLYVRGNPLKYSDPSGHFSEEQLKWMGIGKSDVSSNVWDILSKLELTDRIQLSDVWEIAQVGLRAHIDENGTAFELMLNVGDQQFNAVDWLSQHDQYLPSASINRQVGPGYAEVWRNGELTGPEYHHSLGQRGHIQGKWGARWAKLPGLAGIEAVGYLLGKLLGSFGAAAFGIASDSIEPCMGCEEGDILMTFIYPHHDKGAYQPTARNIWIRVQQNLRVEQTWTAIERPTPFILDNSWGVTP